jgi:hypothetical protein
MVRVVNLMPHAARIIDNHGRVVKIFPQGGVPARVPDYADPYAYIEGVEVVHVGYPKRAEHLPEPRPGVLLIVSRAVAERFPERPDLLFPVGRIKKGGQVIGCRRLGRFSDAPLHTL